jgi:hypothetical protein
LASSKHAIDYSDRAHSSAEPQALVNLARASSASGAGERSHALLFKRKQLLHAGALLHAREMRLAIRQSGDINIELRAAPEAPEKIRIGTGEMFKKMATFSTSGRPSITRTGTRCLGLMRRNSGVRCSSLRMFTVRTSNSALASVSRI